jgi:hypothetical protein
MPDEMPDDAVNVSSEKGKEIIKYAMGSEYTVLEFSVLDNGDFVVADVTDHLKQLEKMHANNDPSTAMDLRTPE